MAAMGDIWAADGAMEVDSERFPNTVRRQRIEDDGTKQRTDIERDIRIKERGDGRDRRAPITDGKVDKEEEDQEEEEGRGQGEEGFEAPRSISESPEPEPARATPTTTDSVAGDADTCRICRGEGSNEEPLFYPCKCSGSIKFVHQDCLMEWLSHSQKKHCELCKTPFRFTKLYSPDMPKHLPPHVFVTHMARYLVRNVLVWMRAALVFSVWLGWLPYFMRSVWSFLFWISDEGLGHDPVATVSSSSSFGPFSAGSGSRSGSRSESDSCSVPGPGHVTGASSSITHVLVNAALNASSMSVQNQAMAGGICPASPLFVSRTTPAVMQQVADHVPGFLQALREPLRFKLNGSSSITATLIRFLFGTTGLIADNSGDQFNLDASINPAARMIGGASAANTTNATANSFNHGSLLSDVGFLKNLTRHTAINRTVIAVLEGQIITILVIVCFILVILVRDYVVQQQPEINMRAAFAGQQDPQDRQEDVAVEEQDPPEPEPEVVDGHRLEPEAPDPVTTPPSPIRRRHPMRALEDGMLGDESDDSSAHELDSIKARYGASHVGSTSAVHQSQGEDPQERSPRLGQVLNIDIPDREDANQDFHQPVLPSPQDSSSGQSISINTPPSASSEESQTTIAQFSQIYRDAGGDREVVLRLIHEKGLEEKLAYWVSVTQSMEKSDDEEGRNESDAPNPLLALGTFSAGGNGSGRSSPDRNDRKGKGKEKEMDHDQGQAPPPPSSSSSMQMPLSPPRPRAVSDGPALHNTIHPLANNNWSFDNMQPPDLRRGTEDAGTRPSLQGRILPLSPAPSEPSEGDEVDLARQLPGDSLETERIAEPQDPQAVPEDGSGHPPVLAPQLPPGLAERVAHFMWGNVGDPEDEEGNALNGEADFAGDARGQFVGADNIDAFDDDFSDDGIDEDDEEPGLAADVAEAAVAAGLDAEALEDGEDFEGIMELIGMRGPIAGLFQNAIFCAFLVSISIFLGIFMPYNIGKVAVWLLANPARILHIVFSFSKLIQDLVLLAVGATLHICFTVANMFSLLLPAADANGFLQSAMDDAKVLRVSSLNRVLASFLSDFSFFSAGEVRSFSVVSHVALIQVKSQIHWLFTAMGHMLIFAFGGDYGNKWTVATSAAATTWPWMVDALRNATASISQPNAWVISLGVSAPSNATLDLSLVYWSSQDRTLTIFGGYVALSVLAGLYLGRGTPFAAGQAAQAWEASIIDALRQASGVMKVILIISIEMLIFPLYCGLLLDFALLPLFEATSFKSRLMFTYNYPLTSIFVHWFVGTGYMFHFALFVSMCRKIMRKGVLYFIRDPDDPEFHPVREVLERNVTTQLRKIMFSAFVYGALVVICLGGVVWGLALAVPGVLPVHYSSNEPVLEFPIDLLFCNFLMPLAVKFFRPSDGLHAMYTWWFRQCARSLRLTWFLFDERRIDEEGVLHMASDSPHARLPWYRRVFLSVGEDDMVVPSIIPGLFLGNGEVTEPWSSLLLEENESRIALISTKNTLVSTGQLRPDGRFVRTPASDQVKMPKGQAIFLEVSETNERIDGKSDEPDADLYATDHYQVVYIPPWFRARIFFFILFIWLFAAVTGVGFTILPLVFGRWMFQILIPAHIRTNDIYAFSIGVYVLGSATYLMLHAKDILAHFHNTISIAVARYGTGHEILLARTQSALKCTAKIVYTYSMLLVVLPLLFTLVIELYVLVPMHTWMYDDPTLAPTPPSTNASSNPNTEGHTIRLIQAWTLGILYCKLTARALVLCGGRPAAAVNAVLRRGWLEPDVRVLTRAFVVPAIILSSIMVAVPTLVADNMVRQGWLLPGLVSTSALKSQHPAQVREHEEALQKQRVLIYRAAYPAAAAALFITWTLRGVLRVLEGWGNRVRDEAYLMGERLHNFGGLVIHAGGSSERKMGMAGGAVGGAGGEWRGGARL